VGFRHFLFGEQMSAMDFIGIEKQRRTAFRRQQHHFCRTGMETCTMLLAGLGLLGLARRRTRCGSAAGRI